MGKKSNLTCFIQWLKSIPGTDTRNDGLKAKVKDTMEKNNVSKKKLPLQ